MKVLVADTDAQSRADIVSILTDEGYKVVSAADAQGLRNHFSCLQVPDLVIVDSALPGLNLAEFLKDFHARADGSGPYIILLTESSTASSAVDDCVIRPVERELLLSRVLLGKRIVELQNHLRGEKNRSTGQAVIIPDKDSLAYLFDSLDALVYAYDMASKELIFVNAAALDVLCGPDYDSSALFSSERIEPSQADVDKKLIDSHGNPAGPYIWEFRHVETGAWYQSRDQAVYWFDGRLIHLSIATSITDRVRAEEVLKTSEKGLRTIHDASFEAIFLVDNERCISQNRAAKKMFGYTLEEAVGLPATAWLIPEDRERSRRNMYAGFELPYEVTALRKDGTTFPAEVQGRLIMYQGRQVRMTALRDISDRKRAAEAERAYEKRFKVFFGAINDAVFVSSVQKNGYGSFLEVNETACRQYGYTREEFLRMSPRDITAGGMFFEESDGGANRQRLVDEGTLVFESTHITRDGRIFPVEINVKLNEQFGQQAMLAVVRDITERKHAEEIARRQEKQFADYFDSVNDAIIVIPFEHNRNTSFIEVNETACQRYGYTREEFLQLTSRDLVPEGLLDRSKLVPYMEELVKTRRAVFETVHVDKSGREIPVEISSKIIEKDGREVILAVVRDITERKQAEDIVRKQEKQFADYFDSVNDAILIMPFKLGGDDPFIEVNETACRRYGYTRDDFLKLTLRDLVPEGFLDNTALAPLWEELVDTRHAVFESVHLDKSGRKIPVEISSKIIERDGEEVILAVVRDLSERKQVENLVIKQQQKFVDYFDSVNDAILVMPLKAGGRENFIEVNRTACERYGYTREEFLNLTLRDMIPEGLLEDPEIIFLWEELLKNRQHVFESVHYNKFGREIPVEISSKIIERDGAEVILSVVRDLTERKQAEELAQRHQRRFEEFFDQINDAIFVFEHDDGDLNVSILEVNDSACRRYGYTAEEFKQLKAKDIISLDAHSPENLQEINAKLEKDNWFLIESEHITKSGERFPVEVNAKLLDDQGTLRILASVRDLSERKRMEELDRAHQKRFEEFFDSLNDPVFIYAIENGEWSPFIEVNETACLKYGYTHDEFMQMKVFDINSDFVECSQETDDFYQELLRTRHLIVETTHTNKFGQQFPVEVSSTLIERFGQQVVLSTARDITARKEAEQTIHQHERRYKDFFGAIDDVILVHRLVETDNGRFVAVNDAACRHYGYSHEEFENLTIHDLLPDEQSYVEIASLYREKLYSEKHLLFETVGKKKSGETFVAEINTSLMDWDGKPTLFSVVRDVSERKKAEEIVRKQEQRFADYFRSINDAIFISPLKGGASAKYIEVNDEACRKFGYTYEEFCNLAPKNMISDVRQDVKLDAKHRRELRKNGHQMFETTLIAKSGEKIPVEVNRNIIDRDGEQMVLSVVRDISERKRAEREIEQLVLYDTLTGLPNRTFFMEQLRQAVARRENEPFALLKIDLDHFKDVNDSFGHPFGDALLQSVANELTSVVRSSDLLARFGDDEFIFLQHSYRDLSDVTVLAEKILAAFGCDFDIEGHSIWMSGSIGIAVCDDPKRDENELLSQADAALVKAKAQGRGSYAFFEDAMTLSMQKELRLAQELVKAIARNELFVEYQPQVDLYDGKLVGVEALVRWNHPQHGVLMPGNFIPVAEKRGLIRDLSNWVMREAFTQSRRWTERALPFGRIAINLCAQQLSHSGFEKDVRAAMTEIGVDPATLDFEFTESVLIDATAQTMESISNLSGLGIGFAIDDFGTGFSSLSYLRKLHTDKIKIDREFVSDILVDSGAEKIISATIALGKTLGLVTIAEGVETSEQAAALKKHGCDFAQGYYYGKSMPAEKIEKLWLQAKTDLNSEN